MLNLKHKNKRLTVMDFTHVYERENFFKEESTNWIDCTEITGTTGYCDADAAEAIRKKIADCDVSGVHFIDAGNYHYVTKFWTEKIREYFTLVVFDHHTDMQKPLFGDILSCGSWILDVIRENPFLKKVILIGIKEEQSQKIPEECRGKVRFVSEEEIETHSFWKQCDQIKEEYPLYISVDKDVLSKNVVQTDWDQGCMKLTELKNILHILFLKQHIIGVDICGECRPQLAALSSVEDDDRFNENILNFLKTEKTENDRIVPV